MGGKIWENVFTHIVCGESCLCTVIAKVRNSIGVVNMFGGVIPPNKFTTPVDFLTFAITARNYVVSICVCGNCKSVYGFRLSNGGA